MDLMPSLRGAQIIFVSDSAMEFILPLPASISPIKGECPIAVAIPYLPE